jgi:hypothetical protein
MSARVTFDALGARPFSVRLEAVLARADGAMARARA